jgi:large subunit ribosomal protein L13
MRSTAMKSFLAKPGQVGGEWRVIDADGKTLGRLAVDIATILMGKHRPTYTPHIDTGDFVVVINAEKIIFSDPNKWEEKEYSWYTGYPGQHRETAAARRKRRPEKILSEAVRRMLPKNKLAFKMLLKLKIYVGSEHPHQSQQPQPLEVAIK